MNPAIEEFQNKVHDLQEVDIGDFRRRLILYINRLQEDLDEHENTKKTLKHMKHIVLYKPHQDSESIREAILKISAQIS